MPAHQKKSAGSFSCRPVKPCGTSVYNLPVSTTMTTATVPAATAVGSATTTVEAATA